MTTQKEFQLETYQNNSNDLKSYYVLSNDSFSEEEAWEYIGHEVDLDLLQDEIIDWDKSVAYENGFNYCAVFHETEEAFLLRNDFNSFKECTDDKIKSVQDFEEDDNLGWCKKINEVTYYKVRNHQDEARTIYFEGEKLKIT